MSSRRAYDGHWRASIPARRKSNSVAPAFVVCTLDTGFSYNKCEREFMPDR